jgi:hypothetical protein
MIKFIILNAVHNHTSTFVIHWLFKKFSTKLLLADSVMEFFKKNQDSVVHFQLNSILQVHFPSNHI